MVANLFVVISYTVIVVGYSQARFLHYDR